MAVRYPVQETEIVGDNTRTGPEMSEQPGLELFDEIWQQVERDHGGITNFGIERVALAKGHSVRYTGLARVLDAFGDKQRVDIDPESARAVVARGGDDDA